MHRLLLASALLVLGYAVVSLLASARILNGFEGEEPSWAKRTIEFRSESDTKTARDSDHSKNITKTTYNSRLPNTNETTLRRFPEYGTAAFSRLCGWTEYKEKRGNCTFLLRPKSGQNEGISDWVCEITTNLLYAQQAGCDLLFDYGPGIDISQVLTPFPDSRNWRVPRGFHCLPERQCFDMFRYRDPHKVEALGEILGKPLIYAPSFRFTYRLLETYYRYYDEFTDMQQALTGFQPEFTMACSLGSLFRLSPTATQFEPELFTRILPALHRKDALVISLYIRTGQTDHAASQEQNNANNPFKEDKSYRNLEKHILDCALGVEEQHLLEHSLYSRVVWMVVTDSQDIKQWITEAYDTTNSTTKSSLPREVITTTSRGAHTRTRRRPSTTDFAEALLDWYLVGESDIVVKDLKSPSFGGTAALRTARPVYDASPKGKCLKITPIHNRTNGMKAKET